MEKKKFCETDLYALICDFLKKEENTCENVLTKERGGAIIYLRKRKEGGAAHV